MDGSGGNFLRIRHGLCLSNHNPLLILLFYFLFFGGQLYSTVTLRQGEKKHYNHKVDAYSFAIVLWELLHNKLPFEGMSNLQAAYAAAFKVTMLLLSSIVHFFSLSFVDFLRFLTVVLSLQNVRPSAEDLPEELATILTSCWQEDPNARPNFSQIIQMLLNYLYTISPPELAIPSRIFTSQNTILAPESPGTSSLMAVCDDVGETPKANMVEKPKGFFFCFNYCY